VSARDLRARGEPFGTGSGAQVAADAAQERCVKQSPDSLLTNEPEINMDDLQAQQQP
jgi:hypothetical protein